MYIMKKNQQGFGLIMVLLVILIVGAISFSAYLVYDNQKNKNNQTVNSNNDVNKENESSDHYLIVKEWGLKFKIPNGIESVEYKINGNNLAIYAKPSGYAVEYRDGYSLYLDGRSPYAIGNLYQYDQPNEIISTGVEAKTGKSLGDKYYFTDWAFNSIATGASCVGLYGEDEQNCTTENVAFKLVNQGENALLNTISLSQ